MIISRVQGAETSSPVRVSARTAVSHFPASAAAATATGDNNLPVRVIRVAAEHATYSPFRSTFFHDPVVNPRLRGDGGDGNRLATARESKRLWTTNGPLINTRTVKTATCPGSAFKNQALSADRLYSTNRHSLGYEVHRSLRGTSLCSTTKRFEMKPRTSESVGPGSYNLTVTPCRQIHHPPPSELPSNKIAVLPSDRLKEWGGRPDPRPMDCANEWKTTSEKPSATVYTFQRARQTTWIEQIEERQRRTDPLAKRLPPSAKEIKITRRAHPEQQLPDYVQGNRNPVHTKASAAGARSPSPQPQRNVVPSPALGLPTRSATAFSPRSFDSLDQQALESFRGFEPTEF